MSQRFASYIDGVGSADDGHPAHRPGINALGEALDAPETYDPKAVQPSTGPASRFDQLNSPMGWSTAAGQTAAVVWLAWADERSRNAPPLSLKTRRVELKRLGRRTDGKHVLSPRGVVDIVQNRAAQNPPKIGEVKVSGGALIDAFISREPDGPWFKCRDITIWNALIEWGDESKPTARSIVDASDAVAVAILARQGVSATAYDLQHGLVQAPEAV
jgi:hypothetical protein